MTVRMRSFSLSYMFHISAFFTFWMFCDPLLGPLVDASSAFARSPLCVLLLLYMFVLACCMFSLSLVS